MTTAKSLLAASSVALANLIFGSNLLAGVATTTNVTVLNVGSSNQPAVSQTQPGAGTSSFKAGTNYTLKYDGRVSEILTYQTSTGTYRPLAYAGTITTTLIRVPNPNFTGSNANANNILYSRLSSSSGNTYNVSAPFIGDEQQAFNSNNINVGTDNLFGNTGDGNGNNNNVERVDVVFGNGLIATNALAFAIFERGTTTGHDPFGIAAITAVDGSGRPTAYGPLVRFGSGSPYGQYGTTDLLPSSTDWLVTRNAVTNQNAPATLPSTVVSNQAMGGVTVAVVGTTAANTLGISAGTTIFGYSLFAGDITGTGGQLLTDPTTFPRNSASSTGAGGIDLIAYTGVAFNEITPVIPAPAPAITLEKIGTFIPSVPAPLTANDIFGLAHNFNALVFGDVQAENGDVDGTFAIGGNATINGGYAVGYVVKGHPIPQVFGGTTDRFIIAGDLADGNFGVNGNIVVGGTRSGPSRELTHGNLLRSVSPITFDSNGNVLDDGSGTSFADLRAQLIATSEALANLADRGVVTKDLSLPYRADLVGNDPALNVFNVDAADWNRTGSSINISAPAGSTVVVNVSGNAVNLANSGMQLTGVDLERVLFNYSDATSLQTTNFAHLGSVLAPQASGDFNAGSIDGRAVLGGHFTSINGFEVHNFHFLGTIPLPAGPPTPAKILYTFTVENTGNVDLENVLVTDPLVTVDGSAIPLAAGATDSTTFTATYFPTAADIASGSFTNTATVTGETAGGAQTASASDTHVLTFPTPASRSSRTVVPGGSAPLVAQTPSSPSPGRATISANSRTAILAAGPSADAAAPPTLKVNGDRVQRVQSRRVRVRGTVSNARRLEIRRGDARILRVKGQPARWAIRSGELKEGRNVIQLRAIGGKGSTSVRIVLIKD